MTDSEILAAINTALAPRDVRIAALEAAVFPPAPAPAATAKLASADSLTAGRWQGKYGGDGYSLAMIADKLPSYATVTVGPHSEWTWTGSTTDIRAVQLVGSTIGKAACLYGDVWTLDVGVGSEPRTVALYFCDWDSQGRRQRIDVLDKVTGAVLDFQDTGTGFKGGFWFVWTLTGSVRFRFTKITGPNAVLMAICFGGASVAPPPPPPPPPPAVIDIPVAAGGFPIRLVCTGMDAARQQMFVDAATWWASAITAELPEATFLDGVTKTKGTILRCQLANIDGGGGILGQGMPLHYRTDATKLPYEGAMTFDAADSLSVPIIKHEMGHALGFGVMWSMRGLLQNPSTADPRFTGPKATAEYNRIFGKNETGVPVEGGTLSGTSNVHWREGVFGGELFTGWLNGSELTSTITLASIGDMGYTVDLSKADQNWQPGQIMASAGPRRRCRCGHIHERIA